MVDLALLCSFPLSHRPIAVPVVVVFTKCDALSAIAIGKLTSEERQLPREEKLAKIDEYVKEMLRNSTGWERLKGRKYPPKACVHLESKYKNLVIAWLIDFFTDMHMVNNGCKPLLERTAAALNEEALQMLLATTQHSNMMICIRYAVER